MTDMDGKVTASTVLADLAAGRADRDPYDDLRILADEVRRLRTQKVRLRRVVRSLAKGNHG